jgi:hypothetical protein
MRACPHLHVSIKTNCPKWSDSFTTVSGERGGIIARKPNAGSASPSTQSFGCADTVCKSGKLTAWTE